MDVLTQWPSPEGGRARTDHVPLPLPTGETVHGVLHVPSGVGPHPVVLLLHGFPGWERNFDVAHALRRAGFATLVFHYRGCRGMPGRWSWSNTLADAESVLDLLRAGSVGEGPALDSSRVAVVGHSLGGFLALTSTASRPWVRAVCSISGFDFGAAAAAIADDPTIRDQYVEAFGSETAVLADTDGESLTDELQAFGDRWSLRGLGPSLGSRPVQLIGTELDDITPAEVHHRPLVDAFLSDGVRLTHHSLPTDHTLADHRVQLTDHIVEFMREHL